MELWYYLEDLSILKRINKALTPTAETPIEALWGNMFEFDVG